MTVPDPTLRKPSARRRVLDVLLAAALAVGGVAGLVLAGGDRAWLVRLAGVVALAAALTFVRLSRTRRRVEPTGRRSPTDPGLSR